MTTQIEFWKSGFGDRYSRRNPITPEIWRRLARDWGRMLTATCPPPTSALEVGCNIGRNLVALRPFIPEMHGVEPNAEACRLAQENPDLTGVNIREGMGSDLPFADASIDLVFTSGVLIHVAPEHLGSVTDEIVRVARHYILAIEYFSHEPVSIPYRGHEGFLFKRDFGGFYLDRYPYLRVVDYGFLWQRFDSSDNSNWWLFAK